MVGNYHWFARPAAWMREATAEVCVGSVSNRGAVEFNSRAQRPWPGGPRFVTLKGSKNRRPENRHAQGLYVRWVQIRWRCTAIDCVRDANVKRKKPQCADSSPGLFDASNTISRFARSAGTGPTSRLLSRRSTCNAGALDKLFGIDPVS